MANSEIHSQKGTYRPGNQDSMFGFCPLALFTFPHWHVFPFFGRYVLCSAMVTVYVALPLMVGVRARGGEGSCMWARLAQD